MGTDGFTIAVGIIATGFFIAGRDFYNNTHGEKSLAEPGLLGEQSLLMYALLNHDVIVSAGQAIMLMLTILIVFRIGLWYKVSTIVKTISIATPLLIVLALMTASTYQYNLLIPVLPIQVTIVCLSAYTLLIGKCAIMLARKDHIPVNTHMRILSLAGPLMLMAYALLKADMIIVAISTINCLKALQQHFTRREPAAGIPEMLNQ